MDVKKMEAHKADESGLNAIFDMFDDLGDKVKRIEVGRGSLLKAFLKHRCFELILAASRLLNRQTPGRGDSYGTLRGTLYGAKVYYSQDLSSGTIRVYGHESDDEAPVDPTRSKRSFELAFRA
ncbi:MAG: hypothetical protein ACYTAF_00180 [Planctomycetota bacterium]|jgi:hypothetical protein